jgi:hypothetical protein
MHESLSRTDRDPFYEIPQVLSFEERYAIIIRWPVDEAADEYLLYRAADNSINLSSSYSLIYRGTATEYHDQFVLSQNEQRYLYRLGKRRGGRYFVDLTTPGRAGLGVVENGIEDIFESNNHESKATLLSDVELQINSYYYESNAGDHITIYDEDWYCIDIPGNWTANIIQTDKAAPQHSNDTRFQIEVLGSVPEALPHSVDYSIINTGNQARRFYFRIFPRYSYFQESADMVGGCGQFMEYWLKISGMLPN